MKRPRLVKLKPPQGDEDMADMLLWLLGFVRAGRVKAYSVCLVVEDEKGAVEVVEHASADADPFNELAILGAMRVAEHGLMARRREREEAEES